MTNSTLYTLNGALLVVVFLLVRVLFVPITVSIYAAQYHQWDIFEALGRMTRICHLCNLLQFSFQFYWFIQLVRLASSVVRSWSGQDAMKESRTKGRSLKTERTHNFKT